MTELEKHSESSDLCHAAHFPACCDYTQNGNQERHQNLNLKSAHNFFKLFYQKTNRWMYKHKSNLLAGGNEWIHSKFNSSIWPLTHIKTAVVDVWCSHGGGSSAISKRLQRLGCSDMWFQAKTNWPFMLASAQNWKDLQQSQSGSCTDRFMLRPMLEEARRLHVHYQEIQ